VTAARANENMSHPPGAPNHSSELYATLTAPDHALAPHTCGDILRGHIHYRCLNPNTTITHLSANFKCKIRTLISTGSGNNRRTYKSKVYLFHFNINYINNATPMTGTSSWPFEWQIPWTTLPHPTQTVFGPSADFDMGDARPLPPSMEQWGDGHSQSITYYVEPVAVRPGKLITHKVKDKLCITFRPPRADPNPGQQLQSRANDIVRESRLLDPVKAAQPWGMKEKTKSLFKSSKDDPDPRVRFTLRSSMPMIAVANQPMPLNLELAYDKDKSTAPTQPSVELVSFHARLTAVTSFRVAVKALFSVRDYGLVRQNTSKIDICNVVLKPQPIHDGMRLGELIPTFGISADIPPTFKSFSISRGYVLKVTARVKCAERIGEIELGKHGLLILPEHWRPHPSEVANMPMPMYLQQQHQLTSGPDSGQALALPGARPEKAEYVPQNEADGGSAPAYAEGAPPAYHDVTAEESGKTQHWNDEKR
jgi:hypothetical protein